MYNEVKASLACPSCKLESAVDVQFKYGSMDHHIYAVGDLLIWGVVNIGSPALASVVADGEGGECPTCHYDGDWPAYVFVDHNRIRAVTNATGEYDFLPIEETYIVLPHQ